MEEIGVIPDWGSKYPVLQAWEIVIKKICYRVQLLTNLVTKVDCHTRLHQSQHEMKMCSIEHFYAQATHSGGGSLRVNDNASTNYVQSDECEDEIRQSLLSYCVYK